MITFKIKATMKTLNRTLISLSLVVVLGSCYEQEDPLEDLITRTGNYYPVVANIRDLGEQGYEVDFAPGGSVYLELQYWSLDPIDRIDFYDIIGPDTSLVSSMEYQPAFSKVADTDTLVVNYTVPGLAAGTPVVLLLEVINESTLSDRGSYSFTVAGE